MTCYKNILSLKKKSRIMFTQEVNGFVQLVQVEHSYRAKKELGKEASLGAPPLPEEPGKA